MGAILGGTMRSPFTGIIFSLELTHDVNMLVPLLLAVSVAHGFTVLLLKRSILTEKISRRGFHLSREYAVDPLEILFVREVMRTNIAALPDTLTASELAHSLHGDHRRTQLLYPVVDESQRLKGVVTRNDLQRLMADPEPDGRTMAEIANPDPVVAHPDEPLRVVVYRMAETGFTRFPVVGTDGRLAGMVALFDLLRARTRTLDEERHRERVLRLHLPGRSRATQFPESR
jgi:CBS domain-containing protein